MRRPRINFRAKGDYLIWKGRWLLAAATLAGGLWFAASLAVRLKSPWAATIFIALFLAAYVCAYAQGADPCGLYVRLIDLKRQQYSQVWDALAVSRKEAFRSVSGASDEKKLRHSALSTIDNLVELASIRTQDNVLEVGCGVGRIGRELLPFCLSWTGADISANMLAYASARMRGISNARLVLLRQGGLGELGENSFDVVYATNIFAHLDEIDRWRYVREAFRVLRPAGRIFIDNIDIESDKGWTMFANDAMRFQSQERPPYIPRFSTAAELMAYANRAGFEKVQCHKRPPLVIVTAAKPTRKKAELEFLQAKKVHRLKVPSETQ
jgi:ubiquinone/menaquinone biosynthesis C-methylase UbiE